MLLEEAVSVFGFFDKEADLYGFSLNLYKEGVQRHSLRLLSEFS